MSGFDAQAKTYDSVAVVQAEVARRLATRLHGNPQRILEIGCGTGLLSTQLKTRFPMANLLLTDIAPNMLAEAQARLGQGAEYFLMDGQFPMRPEKFDLITSSLAFQWFDDLPGALARLSTLLAPGGELAFATLGHESFAQWRLAHAQMGLRCGLRDYVAAANFPWPPGFDCRLQTEIIEEHHPDARSFMRSMKTLGAATSPAGHVPVGAGKFRALLAQFATGFTAQYQILYGQLRRPASNP